MGFRKAQFDVMLGLFFFVLGRHKMYLCLRCGSTLPTCCWWCTLLYVMRRCTGDFRFRLGVGCFPDASSFITFYCRECYDATLVCTVDDVLLSLQKWYWLALRHCYNVTHTIIHCNSGRSAKQGNYHISISKSIRVVVTFIDPHFFHCLAPDMASFP